MARLNNHNPDYYRITRLIEGRLTDVVYSTIDNLVIADAASAAAPETSVLFKGDRDILIYASDVSIFGTVRVPGGRIRIIARKVGTIEKAVLSTRPDDPSQTLDPVFQTKETETRDFINGKGKESDFSRNHPVAFKMEFLGKMSMEGTLPQIVDNLKPQGVHLDLKPSQWIGDLEKNISIEPSGGTGDNGDNGHRGPSGGPESPLEAIVLLCDHLDLTKGSLTLDSSGGQGYPGQDGGQGGDGVPGQDGHYNVSVTRSGPQKGGQPTYASYGGYAGRGGNAGTGGPGGNGGNIRCHWNRQTPPSSSRLILNSNPGINGTDGQPGMPGAHGDAGTQYVFITDYYGPGPTRQYDFHYNFLYDGPNPEPGAIATYAPTAITTGSISSGRFELADLGKALDSVFFVKYLQRIRNQYMFSFPTTQGVVGTSKESIASQVGDNLQWFTTVLNLYDFESERNLSPEDIRKKRVYSDAMYLFSNHQVGRTAFGTLSTFVPRLSISHYQKQLNILLPHYQTIEESFTKLAVASTKDIDNNLSQQDVIAKVRSGIDFVEKKQQYLKKQLKIIGEGDLPTADKTLNDRALDLKKLESNLEAEISSHFDGCSLKSILKALEMIAFSPELPMAGVQGAELLLKGVTQVSDDTGESVKKSYLINKVKTSEGNLEDALRNTFHEKYKLIGGKLEDKKEENIVLITKLDALDTELNKFTKTFNLEPDVHRAILSLKQALKNRSDFIIRYNVIVSLLMQNTQKINQLRQNLTDIENKRLEANDPTRAVTVSYLGLLYQEIRDFAMRYVYDATRALDYWGLSQASVKNGFQKFQRNVLWTQQTGSTANFTANDLVESLVSLNNAVDKVDENIFRQPVQSIPPPEASPETRSEISAVISDPDMLSRLKNDRYLEFSIIADNPNPFTKATQVKVLNTENKLNIRITKVRPRLIGVKNKTQKVELNIIHRGEDRFRYLGTIYRYTHESVTATFTQDLNAKQGNPDFGSGGDGTIGEANQETFGSVGVFADWRLEIPDMDINHSLILSGLKRIELEFQGTYIPQHS